MSGPAAALVAVAAVITMGGGSCAVCVATSSKPPKDATAAIASATSTAGDMPASGETGYLNDAAGMQAYLVFPTKDALERWEGEFAKPGSNASAHAVLEGAFLVDRNVRVKAISGSLMYLTVEVLEGAQKGKRGWVDKTWVHKGKR